MHSWAKSNCLAWAGRRLAHDIRRGECSLCAHSNRLSSSSRHFVDRSAASSLVCIHYSPRGSLPRSTINLSFAALPDSPYTTTLGLAREATPKAATNPGANIQKLYDKSAFGYESAKEFVKKLQIHGGILSVRPSANLRSLHGFQPHWLLLAPVFFARHLSQINRGHRP